MNLNNGDIIHAAMHAEIHLLMAPSMHCSIKHHCSLEKAILISRRLPACKIEVNRIKICGDFKITVNPSLCAEHSLPSIEDLLTGWEKKI